MNIRLATAADAAPLLAIYSQYMDTPITFETELPSVEEFSRRIAHIMEIYPFLVCEEDGRLLGYAYGHRQKERAAYAWNAELSIYLDKNCTSRGVGKRLYRCLMALLALQGVRTVYGVVTVPNEKSERLHLGLGFSPAGIHHNTGYKSGTWRDVCWFEKAIGSYDAIPAPVLPLSALPAEQIAAVLAIE